MRKALVFGLAVLAVYVLKPSAEASVPPPDWKPQEYDGPGVLCGSGFVFNLKSGETATKGFLSEGAAPTYIKSDGGSVGIVVHDADAFQVEKTKVATYDSGNIYLVDKVVRGPIGVPARAMYWFQPKNGSPFSVTFYASLPGPNGWGEFPAKDYKTFLDRISSPGLLDHVRCLAPRLPS